MLVKKKSAFSGWLRLTLLAVLFLIIVGGAVYVFVFSSIFRVKEIEVNVVGAMGGSSVTVGDILNGKQYTNILAPFPAVDMAALPYLSSVTVTKNYFQRTVEINVTERQQAFIWCDVDDSQCFWIDDTGFIFSTAPQTTGGDEEVVQDSTGRNLAIGQYVLPTDQFKYFMADMNLINQLNIPVASIQISEADYQGEQMEVFASGGPDLYFGFTFDPVVSGDSSILENLMNSGEWSKYCYVDLTVEYKAYSSKTCNG